MRKRVCEEQAGDRQGGAGQGGDQHLGQPQLPDDGGPRGRQPFRALAEQQIEHLARRDLGGADEKVERGEEHQEEGQQAEDHRRPAEHPAHGASAVKAPVVDLLVAGQELGMEDRHQVGEHQVGPGGAFFPEVVAAGRREAQIAGDHRAVLPGGEAGEPGVDRGDLAQRAPMAGVDPEVGVLGPLENLLEVERQGAAGLLVLPHVVGAGVGQQVRGEAAAAGHVPDVLVGTAGEHPRPLPRPCAATWSRSVR